ncbi:hypothetical protein D3C83_54210 [compost metagenome]
MRWQATAYSYDALALEETQKLLKQLGELSVATADAAKVVATLPPTISRERHAALETRLDHRIDRRVDLFTRDVAGDGFARDVLLRTGFVKREVAADDFPVLAAVHRTVHKL